MSNKKDFDKECANAFGALVKNVRNEQGLTDYAVAQRAGMKAHHIAAIERGELSPRLCTAMRICAALNLQIEFVIKKPEKGA